MQNQLNIIWNGSDPPKLISSNIQKWRKIYGTRLLFWNDEKLSRYGAYFSGLGFHPAKVADICRVLILQENGGWYIDADMEPGNILLGESSKIELFAESPRSIMNGLMYFPIQTDFSEFFKNEILRSLAEEHLNIAHQTGPMALIRALHTFSILGDESSRKLIKVNHRSHVKSRKHPRIIFLFKEKKFYVIDHALATWINPQKKSSISRIKRTIYYLFSDFDSIIYLHEIIKFVFVKKKSLIYCECACNRKVFRNCQYHQLNFWDHLLRIHRIDSLEIANLRDLNIMKISTLNEHVNNQLSGANWWFCKRHKCFVRPNITGMFQS